MLNGCVDVDIIHIRGLCLFRYLKRKKLQKGREVVDSGKLSAKYFSTNDPPNCKKAHRKRAGLVN